MARRILRDITDDWPPHGLERYKRRCRCAICRAAKSEAQRRYKERLRGRVRHPFALARDDANLAAAPEEIKRAYRDRLAIFGRELDALMRKRSA